MSAFGGKADLLATLIARRPGSTPERGILLRGLHTCRCRLGGRDVDHLTRDLCGHGPVEDQCQTPSKLSLVPNAMLNVNACDARG